MQVELVLILVVAGGLVAAALVGAAVASILGDRLVYRRLASRGDAHAGATVGQAAVPAAEPGVVPRPEATANADTSAAAQPSATQDRLSAASALPEAPWDAEAGTPPASPSVAGAEPATFTLPEAPWGQEAGTPRVPLPAPTAAPVASTLPEAAWGQEDPSSPPVPSEIPIPSGADLSQNGAGRYGQRFSIEDGGVPRGPDKPGPRGSDSSAVDGSWGELPTETEADDATGWGSPGRDWPREPDQN